MQVNVGTKNKAKLAAVEECTDYYEDLSSAKIIGVEVDSNVNDQPIGLEETVQGAVNRAKAAYKDCEFSVGLESGLMKVPHSKSGYMDVCVCAIYDGKEIHLGMSSAWEFPDPKVMHMLLDGSKNMSQAINEIGMTDNPDIGQAEGAIGILTKGRLTRQEYTKQAIITALIHIENR